MAEDGVEEIKEVFACPFMADFFDKRAARRVFREDVGEGKIALLKSRELHAYVVREREVASKGEESVVLRFNVNRENSPFPNVVVGFGMQRDAYLPSTTCVDEGEVILALV